MNISNFDNYGTVRLIHEQSGKSIALYDADNETEQTLNFGYNGDDYLVWFEDDYDLSIDELDFSNLATAVTFSYGASGGSLDKTFYNLDADSDWTLEISFDYNEN